MAHAHGNRSCAEDMQGKRFVASLRLLEKNGAVWRDGKKNRADADVPEGGGETVRNRILVGDAIEMLRQIPDGSVQCIISSPPYYGLRSYLDAEHEDKGKEIGAASNLV